MRQVPLMIVSDAPDNTTGLSRITRDLATLLAATPEFRVATLGTGGRGAQEFPWQQYQMGYGEFGELSLPYAWDNFSQGEVGIVFTIFDLSRLLWLAHPEYVQERWLRTWLQDARANKLKMWSYLPIDSTGPHNKLTEMARDVLMGIDRVLCYSPWAADVVRNTIGAEEAAKRGLDWLPHGLNTRTFTTRPIYTLQKPADASEAADETVEGLEDTQSGVSSGSDGVIRIGCVMTNQSRKDWGATAAICAGLVERLKGNVKLWWHVDTLTRSWSIEALVADFELGEYVEITQPPVDDKWLAERYRQCDVTILPSSEGLGYPIFESFACGVPCLHGDYAGGASLMRAFGLQDYLIAPCEWRLDGQHNCVRPVFSPNDWVERIMQILKQPVDAGWLSSRVEHLSYKKLGYVFRRWFKDGIVHVK